MFSGHLPPHITQPKQQRNPLVQHCHLATGGWFLFVLKDSGWTLQKPDRTGDAASSFLWLGPYIICCPASSLFSPRCSTLAFKKHVHTPSSWEHHGSPRSWGVPHPIFQKRKLRLQGDFSELSDLLGLPCGVEVELELELKPCHTMFFPLCGSRKPAQQDRGSIR